MGTSSHHPAASRGHGERSRRWASRTSRLGLVAASLMTLAASSHAEAQLVAREGSSVQVAPREVRYREGELERVVVIDADGSMWLLANGRRFRTELGTDRVIVIGDAAALASLDVRVDEVLSLAAGIVAVRSTREGEGALALASRLAAAVQAGVVEGASPDLAFVHVQNDITVPPNDTRYGGQWFYETIHMEDAWSREDGDPSVTIAVVDNGCDVTHPDLAAHMLEGYDALEDDDDPSYLPGASGNEHGTACAGLVAAVTDNDLDVAGTCPECSLRCIRLLGAPGTLIPISTDVRAFEFARTRDDVAVISNSWGFEAGAPAPLALVREIEMVMTSGRGGRGALVVFAAGNDASVIGDGELQAIPGVLTVGAINTFDEAASFSNSGASVAMVAPTGTLTTDVAGSEGGAPGDVTTSFGGTSSACPIVAGVGGLLASAAPDLTGAELREALVASVRPAPFATPDESGHDLLYGYGIVDPRAALDRVEPVAPDAGGSDAGALGDDAGTMSPPPSGCACRAGVCRAGAGSEDRSNAGLAALGLALAAMVRRARRR